MARIEPLELQVSVDINGEMFPEVASLVDELPNDRYTTTPTLTWCKRRLGVEAFDLDVAACAEAHHAERYYYLSNFTSSVNPLEPGHLRNGLRAPWDAARIWCNPPYDDLRPWVWRAWSQLLEHRKLKPVFGMLIPDNRREQPFWQELIEPYRDNRRSREVPPAPHDLLEVASDAGLRLFTHSLPGRQPFGVPGNPEGKGQGAPPFGVVLLEWRFC